MTNPNVTGRISEIILPIFVEAYWRRLKQSKQHKKCVFMIRSGKEITVHKWTTFSLQTLFTNFDKVVG